MKKWGGGREKPDCERLALHSARSQMCGGTKRPALKEEGLVKERGGYGRTVVNPFRLVHRPSRAQDLTGVLRIGGKTSEPTIGPDSVERNFPRMTRTRQGTVVQGSSYNARGTGGRKSGREEEISLVLVILHQEARPPESSSGPYQKEGEYLQREPLRVGNKSDSA